jgi:hypothetical protein
MGEYMRTLTVFIDMFNTDLLKNYNKKQSKTLVDDYFENFGGLLYTNVWTPCPDTARSLSSFWSGIPCYRNGCNKRGKYPSDFLIDNSFLDKLEKSNVEINIFAPTNRKEMIFPAKYTQNSYQLNNLEDLNKVSKNSYSFIDLPDLHHVIDDRGSTKRGMNAAHLQLIDSLNYIFDTIDKNLFDRIIFFSDHGNILTKEINTDTYFIGSARSRIFLLIYERGNNKLKTNNNFSSITEISKFILKDKKFYYDQIILDEIDTILVEDFKSTLAKIEQVPNIWMYKTLDETLVFNNFQLVELFDSGDRLFKEAYLNYPHLLELIKEYRTFNKYLLMKDTKLTKFYFNGSKRKKILYVKILKYFVPLVISIMPPFFYNSLKKIIK